NGDEPPAKGAAKPAAATIKAKAPAAAETAAAASPFAFDEDSPAAPPAARKKADGDEKPAPRPARAKSEDEDDEPMRVRTLLWFGLGGVALVVLLGGGLLALVSMNTKPAAKEVAVVAPNPDKQDTDTVPPPAIAEKNTKAASEKKKIDRTIPDKRPNGIAA